MNKLCTKLVYFCSEHIPPIHSTPFSQNTEKPRNALNRARWSSTGSSSLLLLCAFASCHWRAISFHFATLEQCLQRSLTTFPPAHKEPRQPPRRICRNYIAKNAVHCVLVAIGFPCHNPCGISDDLKHYQGDNFAPRALWKRTTCSIISAKHKSTKLGCTMLQKAINTYSNP